MPRMIRIVQLTLRLTAVALLILGILLWTGHPELKQAHMGLGLVFVIALWSLAAIGFRMQVGAGLATRVVIWGFVVLGLGMIQGQILSGSDSHVYVRILHLAAGLIALGVAEFLGARIKRSHKALDSGIPI
jgi:hypothetical protein